jgi:hypothetical protein
MDINVPNICNVYDTFFSALSKYYLNKKSRYWFGRKKCPCPTNQRRDQSGYYYITAHQSLVSKQTDKALRTHLLTHIL